MFREYSCHLLPVSRAYRDGRTFWRIRLDLIRHFPEPLIPVRMRRLAVLLFSRKDSLRLALGLLALALSFRRSLYLRSLSQEHLFLLRWQCSPSFRRHVRHHLLHLRRLSVHTLRKLLLRLCLLWLGKLVLRYRGVHARYLDNIVGWFFGRLLSCRSLYRYRTDSVWPLARTPGRTLRHFGRRLWRRPWLLLKRRIGPRHIVSRHTRLLRGLLSLRELPLLLPKIVPMTYLL